MGCVMGVMAVTGFPYLRICIYKHFLYTLLIVKTNHTNHTNHRVYKKQMVKV